jgi:hypothetical protein
MSLNSAAFNQKPLALAKPLQFGAQFDQTKPLADEADTFASQQNYLNKNNSIVHLTDLYSGAPLDSLLRVQVEAKSDGENAQPTKKSLISAETVLAWAKYDHFKPLRECQAYVSQQVNPLIALAAGIAHGADFGRCGWTRLNLNPLKEEFPRVVEAISSRIPKKILALDTLEASNAGLSPILKYLAENTDKYYVSDNKAVLISAES